MSTKSLLDPTFSEDDGDDPIDDHVFSYHEDQPEFVPATETVTARRPSVSNELSGLHTSSSIASPPSNQPPNIVPTQPTHHLPGLFATTTPSTKPAMYPHFNEHELDDAAAALKEKDKRQRRKGNSIYPPPPPDHGAGPAPAAVAAREARQRDRENNSNPPPQKTRVLPTAAIIPTTATPQVDASNPAGPQLVESSRAAGKRPQRNVPPVEPLDTNTSSHTAPPPPPPGHPPPPPEYPSNPEPPLPTGEKPIPATLYSAPYFSRFLGELTKTMPLPHGLHTHFSNLACSYLSHPEAPAPSMAQLKKHAQDLCLLITLLSAHGEALGDQNAEGKPGVVLDFLPDLLRPYVAKGEGENKALRSLENTLAVHMEGRRDWPTGPDSRLLGCPATELDDVGRLLRHVNEMLEIIDATYEDEGGLLAAMPDLHSLLAEESNRQLRMEEAKTLCEGTILGQWMGFTQNLIKRVAELEREVVGLREVLGGEHMTPKRTESRAKENGKGKGKGKKRARDPDPEEEDPNDPDNAIPQDRYVLAGLSEALWSNINDELDLSETHSITRSENARKRGFYPLGGNVRVRRPANEQSGEGQNEGEEKEELGNVTSWIECTSRIYRVLGRETLYVVPAWDIRPGMRAVLEVESGPLVMSVPVAGTREGRTLPPEPDLITGGGVVGGGGNGGGRSSGGGGGDAGGQDPNEGAPKDLTHLYARPRPADAAYPNRLPLPAPQHDEIPVKNPRLGTDDWTEDDWERYKRALFAQDLRGEKSEEELREAMVKYMDLFSKAQSGLFQKEEEIKMLMDDLRWWVTREKEREGRGLSGEGL